MFLFLYNLLQKHLCSAVGSYLVGILLYLQEYPQITLAACHSGYWSLYLQAFSDQREKKNL